MATSFHFAPWEQFAPENQDGRASFMMPIPLKSGQHPFVFYRTPYATFFRDKYFPGPFHNSCLAHQSSWRVISSSSHATSPIYDKPNKKQLTHSIQHADFFRIFHFPHSQFSVPFFVSVDPYGDWQIGKNFSHRVSGDGFRFRDDSRSLKKLRFGLATPSNEQWKRLMELWSDENSSLSQMAANLMLPDEQQKMLLFQTERETPSELFNALSHALLVIHPFWQNFDAAVFSICPWGIGNCYTTAEFLCVEKNGVSASLTLPVRERVLLGKILRYFGLSIKDQYGNETEFVRQLRAKTGISRVDFEVRVQTPSFHERLEAIQSLSPLLARIWPDSQRHFAKIV